MRITLYKERIEIGQADNSRCITVGEFIGREKIREQGKGSCNH